MGTSTDLLTIPILNCCFIFNECSINGAVVCVLNLQMLQKILELGQLQKPSILSVHYDTVLFKAHSQQLIFNSRQNHRINQVGIDI